MSPNKCITIRMYFCATNKATSDKTLKLGKNWPEAWETVCGKHTTPRNKNRALKIFTNDRDRSQSLHNMNVLRNKVGTFCPFSQHKRGCYKKCAKFNHAACIHHKQIKPEKCAENVYLAYVRKKNMLKIWFDHCFRTKWWWYLFREMHGDKVKDTCCTSTVKPSLPAGKVLCERYNIFFPTRTKTVPKLCQLTKLWVIKRMWQMDKGFLGWDKVDGNGIFCHRTAMLLSFQWEAISKQGFFE